VLETTNVVEQKISYRPYRKTKLSLLLPLYESQYDAVVTWNGDRLSPHALIVARGTVPTSLIPTNAFTVTAVPLSIHQ